MTLTYEWENQIVNRVGYSRTISPHTQATREDVIYDYEAEVVAKDIMEFIEKYPSEQDTKIDYLLEDDSFYYFMKDKYEKKAYEEWSEGNDSF